MKYPENQFNLLVKSLEVLSVHFDLSKVHPASLQYLVYQQASEGQTHNALFINESGNIAKGFVIEGKKDEYKKLIPFLNEGNFPLYPYGCNDTHIETAVKAALKKLS